MACGPLTAVARARASPSQTHFFFLGEQRGHQPQGLHFLLQAGQFHFFLPQYFINILHDHGTCRLCRSLPTCTSHFSRLACVVKGFRGSGRAEHGAKPPAETVEERAEGTCICQELPGKRYTHPSSRRAAKQFSPAPQRWVSWKVLDKVPEGRHKLRRAVLAQQENCGHHHADHEKHA